MAKKKPEWRQRIAETLLFKDFYRLPTGIFELDFALGGGFPIGVTSNIFGTNHSFKSGVLYRLVATAQNWCWKCHNYIWDCVCEDGPTKKDILFIDSEITDWEWASRLGVNSDDDRLYIEEPAYAEEAIDIIYDALRDKSCGLVIVDSITRLLPKEEIDAQAGDFKVGIRAKLQTQLINKVKTALILRKREKDPVMFVATTQMRAKIGGSMSFFGGESEESSAPYALAHDWHLSMKMNKLMPDKKDRDRRDYTPYVGRFKSTISSLKTKRKMFVLSGTAYFKVVIDERGGILGKVLDQDTFKEYAHKVFGNGLKVEFPDQVFPNRKQLKEWAEKEENKQKYLSYKKQVIDILREWGKEGTLRTRLGEIQQEQEENKGEEDA